MRQAEVLYKDEVAGLLIQKNDGAFQFCYSDSWYSDSSKPAISLTLPKNEQEYTSKHLFPFFYNMLPEGSNKEVVCYELRLDPDDYFGILLSVAENDTIGAIKIKKV
ncbi:HipA N-terminal domain-containing protein [Joostella atrarenae]|uniref:HipA N-terminal domain-containing protein n=1 Tax=Joostella atrarenae TaxID=679257 RepID=A0ABS9J1H5_9FLAO|nr:HipA N-terminal domain-containing protein [Joostella atrarenae]MCF8714271.1 HipA N-terminal domain-containing protein [Joostella atrarenae]